MAGKIRNEPGVCDYRHWITCKEKSRCGKCGWNPEEEQKIRNILHDGGIKAVREYITARDAPLVVTE